jgi:hypothetical protein
LNLRTDLTKDERAESLKVCTEILDSFKNYTDSNAAAKKGGIFSNLDIAQATQIQGSNDVENNANDDDDSMGINIDDFLKEGGIDIDVLDPNKKGEDEEEKKDDVSMNTDPDEKMTGHLYKSSIKMEGQFGEGGDDIVGTIISGFGGGLKLGFKFLTETVQIKKKKNYFAIKSGILYWYSKERSRSAANHIPIKETKAIEINSKNPKEFYIFYKSKCYRFESQHEYEAQKWVNSLKLVKESGFEYLDENRYEKQKIYSKITGKTIFKDYELLLEQYEGMIHENIEKKLNEYLAKNFKNKFEA